MMRSSDRCNVDGWQSSFVLSSVGELAKIQKEKPTPHERVDEEQHGEDYKFETRANATGKFTKIFLLDVSDSCLDFAQAVFG